MIGRLQSLGEMKNGCMRCREKTKKKPCSLQGQRPHGFIHKKTGNIFKNGPVDPLLPECSLYLTITFPDLILSAVFTRTMYIPFATGRYSSPVMVRFMTRRPPISNTIT